MLLFDVNDIIVNVKFGEIFSIFVIMKLKQKPHFL